MSGTTRQFSPLILHDDSTGRRNRVRAVECEAAARKAADPELKDTYLNIARSWRDLADEVDRFELESLIRGDPVEGAQ